KRRPTAGGTPANAKGSSTTPNGKSPANTSRPRPSITTATSRCPGRRSGWGRGSPTAPLGSPQDVSDQLLPMLERNRPRWQDKEAPFYADRGRRAGKYLAA